MSSKYDDTQFLKEIYGTGRHACVYRDSSSYRAKVLKRFVIGTFKNDEEAAQAVVKWYRDRYGDEWRAVIAGRHIRPVDYLKRDQGGYRVRVWLYGRPVFIQEKCGKQVIDFYPTLQMAKDGYARWLKKEFGMFASVAPLFIYKTSAKFRS